MYCWELSVLRAHPGGASSRPEVDGGPCRASLWALDVFSFLRSSHCIVLISASASRPFYPQLCVSGGHPQVAQGDMCHTSELGCTPSASPGPLFTKPPSTFCHWADTSVSVQQLPRGGVSMSLERGRSRPGPGPTVPRSLAPRWPESLDLSGGQGRQWWAGS